MPSFSPRSRAHLDSLDERLKILTARAIKVIDFSIICGHRSNAEQQQLYAQGYSRLKPGASKHNKYPSLAFDAAPYPVNWNDHRRFVYMAGIFKGIAAQMDLELRWGGDWDGDNDLADQTFFDLAHFEIKT